MIVESHIVALGMKIHVSCFRQGSGYAAELEFEGGDRAVIDARTAEELEDLLQATVAAAAAARQYDAHRFDDEKPIAVSLPV